MFFSRASDGGANSVGQGTGQGANGPAQPGGAYGGLEGQNDGAAGPADSPKPPPGRCPNCATHDPIGAPGCPTTRCPSCHSAENAPANGCPTTGNDDRRIGNAGRHEADGSWNGNVSFTVNFRDNFVTFRVFFKNTNGRTIA